MMKEAIVEQTVIQNDCLYVNPSLDECTTPKIVMVMILITSRGGVDLVGDDVVAAVSDAL